MSRAPHAERTTLHDALHAEWTKLRTVAGTGWLLLAAVTLTVALSAATAAAATYSDDAHQDVTKLSLTGVHAGQALVAMLAVLTFSGEHSTGMIGITLTAMPRRGVVLAAKAANLTGLVLVAGTIGVLGSVLAGRLILPAHGFTAAHGHPPLSLADGSTVRAAAGSVLYLVLIGLLSLGVATAVRDAAAAAGIALGLLYGFPIVAQVIADPGWQRHVRRVAPMEAGLAVQSTIGLHDLPVAPWAGIGVLAAWAAGALVAGGLLFHRRDAG